MSDGEHNCFADSGITSLPDGVLSLETGFLSFDISAGLGVIKGEHWETNKSTEKECCSGS